MRSVHLQPRPLYGIGTVARLTGIKPDTLRIWERRYQLGASHKSTSGRRQYTQADLEHLQLVAALVSQGARIGEIASSERRTLEMLLRARGGERESLYASKPRVAFVGENLCAWLDEHQGCLMNVDAILAPCSLGELDTRLVQDIGAVDALVVESGPVSADKLQALETLSDTLETGSVLVLKGGDSAGWDTRIQSHGFSVDTFPPDAARLAVYLKCASDNGATQAGSENLGDLVPGKPRLFTSQELAQASEAEEGPPCDCPLRISDMVSDLSKFEECMAHCDAREWADVSVQACVYAYVGQARWLMEKALGLALDAQSDKGDS